MGTRIEKLNTKSTEIVEAKHDIAKLSEINAADRSIIRELLSKPLLDKEDMSSLSDARVALGEDAMLIELQQNEVEHDRSEALKDIESLYSGLNHNLEILREMEDASDFAHDTSFKSDIKGRMDEVKRLWQILDGEGELDSKALTESNLNVSEAESGAPIDQFTVLPSESNNDEAIPGVAVPEEEQSFIKVLPGSTVYPEDQEQEDELEGVAFLGTIGRWLGKPGPEPAHDVTLSDLPAETAKDRHEKFVQQIKANVDPHKALHNVSVNGSSDDVDIGQRELEITRDKFGERGLFTALGLSHRADSSIDAGDFDDSTPIKNQILRESIPGDNRLRAMPRSLSLTKQRWRREIDGSLVYNTPHETAGRLDCCQGKVKNYLGTCGLVSCVNILRLAGVSASEAEIVAYAASTVDEASNAFLSSLSKRTLCVSNSFPAYNGQTGAKARQKILEHFGIPSYTAKQTISTIAEAVESGHGVIVSVYADTLYEGIRTNNGLHAVTITSVKKSATGRIMGFYVADSNAEYQREKAEERGGVGSEFYSVQELESALSERECNITSTIIR